MDCSTGTSTNFSIKESVNSNKSKDNANKCGEPFVNDGSTENAKEERKDFSNQELEESGPEEEIEFLKKRSTDNREYIFESENDESPVKEKKLDNLLSFYKIEFKEPKENLEKIFLGVEYHKLTDKDLESSKIFTKNKEKLKKWIRGSKYEKTSKKIKKKKNLLIEQMTRHFIEDSYQ